MYHAKRIIKSKVAVSFITTNMSIQNLNLQEKSSQSEKQFIKLFFLCYSHFLGFLSENVRLKKFIFFFGSGGVNGAKIYMRNIHNIML